MTHYIVKHGAEDYRVHAEDGTEPLSTNWSKRPDTNDIARQCAKDGPGGSLLGQQHLNDLYTDTLSGELVYRDLTIPDETVPWQ